MPITDAFVPMAPPAQRWPAAHQQSAVRLARRIGVRQTAFLFGVGKETVRAWKKRHGDPAPSSSKEGRP